MPDLIVFIPACFALNLAFGPNNLLALTHGAQAGAGFALRAGLGRILAFIPMIALAGFGLGVVLATSATLFLALKIAGALYLAWLGLRLLRSGASARINQNAAPRFRSAFRSEALAALGNPKAILIFAAFFPHFVDPVRYAESYLAVGTLFLLLEIVALAIYGTAGALLARRIGDRLHWVQRASGAGMILFAALMLFTRSGARA